jgi:acetyl esterase/lipase
MNEAVGSGLDIEESDLAYDERSGLLARLYRPRGQRPLGALLDVHGGAWTSGDRLNNAAIDRALAARGLLVAAVDFRLAPAATYPAAVADVNLAIRWLKSHVAEHGLGAERVGGLGTSSGAQQLLLNALRPDDPDFAALPSASPHDASLRFAVACWPIADPLARYRMAKERGMERLVRNHDAFFGDEATMARGNPQHVLERGEQTHLPPLLVVQGTADDNVTPDMAARLAAAWRRAGGTAELETFEGQPHSFMTRDFAHADSARALDLIARFVTQNLA